MSVMLVLFGITADYGKEIDRRSVPEKIIDTVLAVERSSGVIVYSDHERALVLTAHHTIDDELDKAACCGCDYNISVLNFSNIIIPSLPEEFEVTYIEVDELNDLAIIEIKTTRKLHAAKIFKGQVRFGQEIYVASNPQRLYKSLKSGIISSPARFIRGSLSVEVDAMIIFGSSGGGVFTKDGEFVGTVKSVRLLNTGHCFDVWDHEGNWIDMECIRVPIPSIGFAAHPMIIKRFLLNSVFSKDFDYLR